MKLRDLRLRLLHWRRNIRWRLWNRGVVERCPECVNMGTREWFAMCDCFASSRYTIPTRTGWTDLDNPGFEDNPDGPWAKAGDEALSIGHFRQAVDDLYDAPIRPDYYTICGALSPEGGWVCLLQPTEAAHRGGHFARAPDPSSTAAVWATTLDEWWARRP